jgi:large subunit ribosomal protein L31
MKAVIHPKWYNDAKITCACGNTFTAGAVTETIYVEVCSQCHPFYTGQMKYLDAAGRVEAFKTKLSQASKKVVSKADKRKIKKEKRIKEEMNRPDSLAQLRKQV